MQKRLLAIVICAVIMSAIAATSAVSAKNTDNTINSSIRQYDVKIVVDRVIVFGKLTVNTETGHYVVNANLGKISMDFKDYDKTLAGWSLRMGIGNPDATPKDVYLFDVAMVINGGTVHGEGNIQDLTIRTGLPTPTIWATKDLVAWLDTWANNPLTRWDFFLETHP